MDNPASPSDETRYPGVAMILAERHRQLVEEGYNAVHDQEHSDLELTHAARCYCFAAGVAVDSPDFDFDRMSPPIEWKWHPSFWKPSNDPVRNLVKAGALIAAEIDRMIAVRSPA